MIDIRLHYIKGQKKRSRRLNKERSKDYNLSLTVVVGRRESVGSDLRRSRSVSSVVGVGRDGVRAPRVLVDSRVHLVHGLRVMPVGVVLRSAVVSRGRRIVRLGWRAKGKEKDQHVTRNGERQYGEEHVLPAGLTPTACCWPCEPTDRCPEVPVKGAVIEINVSLESSRRVVDRSKGRRKDSPPDEVP
jgi:hypothetical protein